MKLFIFIQLNYIKVNYGLKNGEELKITKDSSGNVYVQMLSDPTLVHSDNDGMNDYVETMQYTDPMVCTYNSSVKNLIRDDYEFDNIVNLYDTDWIYRKDQEILASSLSDDLYETSQKTIINYLSDYSNTAYVTSETNKNIKKTVHETVNDALSKTVKFLKTVKKSTATADEIAGNFTKAAKLQKQAAEINDRINSLLPTADADTTYNGLVDLLQNNYNDTMKEFNDLDSTIVGSIEMKVYNLHEKYKKFMDSNVAGDLKVGKTIHYAFSAVSLGIDVSKTVATFSKINANSKVFEANLDLLNEIHDTSKHDDVKNAAKTIINATGKSAGGYATEVSKAITYDTLEAVKDELVSVLGDEIPAVKAYSTIMSLLKLTNLDEKVSSTYKIICLNDMGLAAQKLLKDSIVRYPKEYVYFYDCVDGDNLRTERYIRHSANLAILAEKEFLDNVATKEIKTRVSSELKTIKTIAKRYIGKPIAS